MTNFDQIQEMTIDELEERKMEQCVTLLEKKDCDFSRHLLDHLLQMFKESLAK